MSRRRKKSNKEAPMLTYKYCVCQKTPEFQYFLQYMANAFGQNRFSYNFYVDYIDLLLAGVDDFAQKWKLLPSEFELRKHFRHELRPKKTWLQEGIDKFYFEMTIHRVHCAYERYLKGISEHPKFHRKYAPTQSVTTKMTNGNIKVERINEKYGWISLPYLNGEHKVKVFLHRDPEGEIKEAHIIREGDGKYYIAVVCEVPKKPLPATDKAVGIDLGVKDLIVKSDGKKYPALKALKKSEKKLKRTQKKLSRQYEAAKAEAQKEEEKQKKDNHGNNEEQKVKAPIKVSKNYLKTKQELAKIHKHIANQRKDYCHKATSELVHENQILAMESLTVSFMVKNHKLASAVLDACFGRIKQMLEYKCNLYGRTLVQVPPHYPSTQRCPNCGYINKELAGLSGLKIREWTCPVCQAHHDRDIAAAESILQEGLRILEEAERDKVGGGTRQTQACGAHNVGDEARSP